ncbi:hypothetical protein G6F43_012542 [Rhizopus delemar]|nr:hypothetical protein G6F43_012542 [Rhizopus delemar]
MTLDYSAHTRIAELEKSFERTADSPRIPSPAIKLVQGSEASKYSDTVDIEPTPIPAPPTAPSFAAAALKGAKAQPKPIASNPKRHRRVTPRQYKAIARSFTTVSESHGYQYIYLPSRNREPISVLRSKLRKLKIDTARILDLHFPDSHVVALLVHNDYSDDLLSIFDKVGVKPITDFNPIDPDHLRDPKFAELDQDTRKHKCVEIHQMRLIRALQHIREPIQRAVARDFLRKTWITVDQFRSLYNTTSATNFSTDPVDTDMVDTIQSFTAPIASSTTFSGAGEPGKEDI